MELNISWHNWKKILHKALKAAGFVGLTGEQINKMSYWLGEFLANKTDPGNREQRLIKELWDEADEEEKMVLARLIVRMVDKTTKM